LALRGDVGLKGNVPVEVVIGDVEADARIWSHFVGTCLPGQVVELVARQFDDEHVEALRVADRVEYRDADVAARGDAETCLGDHRGRQLDARRLAVRPRYEDPLG